MSEYFIYFNQQWVGDHPGLCIIDVADDDAATTWAARVAEACGWPQEVRRFKPHSPDL